MGEMIGGRSKVWVVYFFLVLGFVLVWGGLSVARSPFEYPDWVGYLPYEEITGGLGDQPLYRFLIEPWFRWDTGWYMHIAVNGYHFQGDEIAFPPLYPALVGLVGRILGGHYLLASLLVSWVALFFACGLLYEQFCLRMEPHSAQRAMIYFLIFPTAFFFYAGYTESLFLLLMLLAWRSAQRDAWWQAGVFAALATLTRFMGVFLLVPLGVMWLKTPAKLKLRGFAALSLVPLAYMGWSLFAKAQFGYLPSEALDRYWNLKAVWPWVGVIGDINRMKEYSFTDIVYVYLDLLAVLVVSVTFVWTLTRRAWAEAAFVLAILLVSVVKIWGIGLLVSTSRYVLPLFPVYWMLAEWGRRWWAGWAWAFFSLAGWLLASAWYFRWEWLA